MKRTALEFAAPNTVGLVNATETSLQYAAVSSKANALTISAANTITLNKPLGASFSPYTVQVKLAATNLTSPINQLAPLQSSFANASKLPDGLAGARELINFDKSYTGPMTNATLDAANKASVQIGVVSGTANAVGSVNDRLTVASQAYTLYTGKGAVVDMGVVFTLEVTSATVNGTYTFNVNVGGETKTVSVIVASPTPTINLFVENLTTNAQNIDKLITPDSTGRYKVALASNEDNATATVKLDFIGNFLKPATGTTISYTLTRTYDFKTNNSATATADKWTNIRTDVVTFQDLLGGDGAVKASALNNIMHGRTSIEVNETTLVLPSVGTYTFKLEIGTAVREFVIEVLPFPTLKLENAFVGTRSSADVDTIGTTPLAIFDKDVLVKASTYTGTDPRNVYLSVSGVNLPANTYYKVYAAGGNSASPTDASPYLLATELDDAKLTFTSGLATIMVPVTGSTNLTAAKSQLYFVSLYSGNGLRIGSFRVIVRVMSQTDNTLTIDGDPVA
jgi:hypothetical protein